MTDHGDITLERVGGMNILYIHTVKKRLPVFPSPAGMSLTKLALAGNNLIIPGQGEFVTV